MKRLTAVLLLFPMSLLADVREVKLKLPLKPKLQIAGDEKVAIAPFVIATTGEKRNDRAARVDVQAEFHRYLKKQMQKSTKLRVVDIPGGIDRLPGTEMKDLESARDFWRELGQRTGADFIVTGILDFDINDKTGYKTEEYTSPADGRTFYRQVLVETTGFVFDIDIAVFNADTGEKVVEESFRDYKEFDQRHYDEILGLFENLRAVETQLVGIFVSQETSATRYVFSE